MRGPRPPVAGYGLAREACQTGTLIRAMVGRLARVGTACRATLADDRTACAPCEMCGADASRAGPKSRMPRSRASRRPSPSVAGSESMTRAVRVAHPAPRCPPSGCGIRAADAACGRGGGAVPPVAVEHHARRLGCEQARCGHGMEARHWLRVLLRLRGCRCGGHAGRATRPPAGTGAPCP